MAARMEASFFLGIFEIVWDISTKKAHKGYFINNIFVYLPFPGPTDAKGSRHTGDLGNVEASGGTAKVLQ